MKFYLSILIILLSLQLCAQIPNGYYDLAQGKTGQDLKSALSSIISNATTLDYSNINNYYPSTDKTANGNVWDMYSYVFSSTQNYTYQYGVHECDANLQYNSEGDCFNKEHLWPQSLYGQGLPMRSDLHQVYPTDGWVNNKRSNFPFGDVSQVDWTSTNGSLLGTSSTYANYSGKVFEPLDSFKGDIARALFYVSTRYQNQGSGWTNWPMASGSNLTTDAITLLLTWHELDPVSQKEIDRNNAVFNIQSNRNPFVDYPEFAKCIWGSNCIPLSKAKPKKSIGHFVHGNTIFAQSNAIFDRIEVYDLFGQNILNKSTVRELSMDEFASGFYVIKMYSGGQSQSLKFLKQ